MLRPFALTPLIFFLVTCTALTIGAGCGPKHSEALSAALTTVDGARAGFEAFDRQYQERIALTGTSRQDIDDKLAAYRAKREPVLRALELTYRALAIAGEQRTESVVQAALVMVGELVKQIGNLTGAP